MSARPRCCGIILAAGVGSRMGAATTKQKIKILGRSILYYTLTAFENCPDIDDIVIVVREDEIEFAKCESAGMKKVYAITVGGDCRAESARMGFLDIPPQTELVAIHDAARALITPDNISAVVKVAAETGAATAASRLTDTIKFVNNEGIIEQTIGRGALRRAETPQVFSTKLYARAVYATATTESITDDNMLLERICVKISTVDVGRENMKITTAEDLKYAEFLLRERGWGDA